MLSVCGELGEDTEVPSCFYLTFLLPSIKRKWKELAQGMT